MYIVMDYHYGGELYFHLNEENTFHPKRVKIYCAEIATGIAYLHKEGILHGYMFNC